MKDDKGNQVQPEEPTLTLLLYRLDKLEEEQRRDNKEIMKVLQTIQENQHSSSEKIVQHTTELERVNARLNSLEEHKVDDKEFTPIVNHLENRLDVYKQVLMAVAGGVGVSLLIEFFKII